MAKNQPPEENHGREWVVRLGLPALAVGVGAGMMGYVNYYFGCTLVVLGLAVFLIDLIYISRGRPWLNRWTVVMLIFVVSGYFAWIVFRPTPITFKVSATKAVCTENSVIAGIKWYPGCVDVRIFIINPTDMDYDDADISITANDDLMIMGMGKITPIDASFFAEDELPPAGLTFSHPGDSGNMEKTPVNPSGWAYHYRIRITKIPRKSSTELIAFLAWLTPPPHDRLLNRQLLGPARLPTSIRLLGGFKASGKPVHIDGLYTPIGEENLHMR